MGGVTLVKFPFEWNTKADVLQGLKHYKIPQRCWWTCESPKRGRPCGRCLKCVQLQRAKEDVKMGRGNDDWTGPQLGGFAGDNEEKIVELKKALVCHDPT
jgi:hypothetical protein